MVAFTYLELADESIKTSSVTITRLQELLRFGGLMLSAGETAFRVRRSMGAVACGLGFESLSVQLGSRNLVASGRRDGETATLVRDLDVPRVDTERIGALEALARCIPFEMTAHEFATELESIETAPLVGFSIETPPHTIAEPLTIFWWAVASFCGGCGLAILYNGTWRNVLYVGVIALIGNEVRLLLHDTGVALPLATFLGSLAVGLTASIAGRWIKEARVALTVPAAVMMVPGLYALETLVYFDRGEILKGLSAGVSVGFVVGSIAFGLATARFISQPEWLTE